MRVQLTVSLGIESGEVRVFGGFDHSIWLVTPADTDGPLAGVTLHPDDARALAAALNHVAKEVEG